MIATLETSIRAKWPDLGLPGKAPAQLEFHLCSGPGGRHGHVVARAFRRGDPKPLFLLKIPRDGTARRWTLHEHDLLQSLEESAPRLAGRRFPRALLLAESGARLAAGRTILPGLPLDRRFGETNSETDTDRHRLDGFAAAREWLEEFWRETGFVEAAEAARWEPYLRAAHYFLENFDPAVAIRREIEAWIEEVERRGDRTALCGYAHGDFGPAALRGERGRLGATDWEFGEIRAFPWQDPVQFALATALLTARRAGRTPREAWERAFRTPGRDRDETAAFLDACFAEGGVAAGTLDVALPAQVLRSAHRAARLHAPEAPAARTWRALVEVVFHPEMRDMSYG